MCGGRGARIGNPRVQKVKRKIHTSSEALEKGIGIAFGRVLFGQKDG